MLSCVQPIPLKQNGKAILGGWNTTKTTKGCFLQVLQEIAKISWVNWSQNHFNTERKFLKGREYIYRVRGYRIGEAIKSLIHSTHSQLAIVLLMPITVGLVVSCCAIPPSGTENRSFVLESEDSRVLCGSKLSMCGSIHWKQLLLFSACNGIPRLVQGVC